MLLVMAVPDASMPAAAAIEEFGRRLADRGLSATTRRIRVHFLREYLRHALASRDAGGPEGPPGEVPVKAEEVTAGGGGGPPRGRARAAAAPAGKTPPPGPPPRPGGPPHPPPQRARGGTTDAVAPVP